MCEHCGKHLTHRRWRQLPLHKGAFSYFVRTLREYTLLLARAIIGRPFCVNLNSVGGHSICPRCVGFHPNNRRREQAPALRGTKRKFQTAGGVSPPGGGVLRALLIRRGNRWSPLHMAHLNFVMGAGFPLLCKTAIVGFCQICGCFRRKGFSAVRITQNVRGVLPFL